jgi:hypothetical protein
LRHYRKSGFATKFEASKASGVALGRHQDANEAARKGDTRTLGEYLDYWLDNRYIEGICSSCHDVGLIRSTEATKEEWYDVVMRMNGKDAGVSARDVDLLVDYLASKYGPKKVKSAAHNAKRSRHARLKNSYPTICGITSPATSVNRMSRPL